MASEVNLELNGIPKIGLVGFSWTTFFFGFLVPMLRGDVKWAIIMLALGVCTMGLANFILCFAYNNIYTRGLLEKGYRPVDDYSAALLAQYDLLH